MSGALIRTFGLWKGLAASGLGLLVVSGSLALNAERGWPFGFAVHHDILGWRLLNIAWPIPVFYSFVTACGVILMQPKTPEKDPKTLFSWAFDAALLVMGMALLSEPLASTTHAITWIVPGAILGTPASALLGWFVTAFVAAIAMILGARLWQANAGPMKMQTLWVLAGFSLLMFGLATNLQAALSQILTAVAFVAFGIWSFVLFRTEKKTKKEASLDPAVYAD